MNKKLLPYQTVLAFVVFTVMALVCGQTAYSQTGNVSFPSNFMETWKRDNFNNTLTFTTNTLTSSSQTFTWTLSSVSGNTYKMNNGKTNTTVTIRLDGGNLIISGDSGSGQDNWNGTWKIKPSTKVEGANLIAKLVWVLRNAQSNGDYTIELNGNESLSAQTLVFEGKTNVTLPFIASKDEGGYENEYEIALNGNGSLFTVASGVNLMLGNGVTLCGHEKNNASLVVISEKAIMTMNEGSKIIDNNGGGVRVNGTLTMNGGEISGNTNNKGGGVEVVGTFAMNGGEIYGNTGDEVFVNCGIFTMNGGKIIGNKGVGVLVQGSEYGYGYGTFNINGGEISNNNSSGVYVSIKSDFTMSGGKISGNTNANGRGGGVSVSGSYYTSRGGTFTMSGGEISGNTASSGGGVYNWGTFTMSGGEISDNTASGSGYDTGGGGVKGNITMSGGKIFDNTTRGSGGGVNGNITMSNGEIYGNTTVESGGGVYGKLTKNGGIIYGYKEGDSKSNVVKNNSGVVQVNKGHAVFIDDAHRRESTAESSDNLDPNKTGLAGGWGY